MQPEAIATIIAAVITAIIGPIIVTKFRPKKIDIYCPGCQTTKKDYNWKIKKFKGNYLCPKCLKQRHRPKKNKKKQHHKTKKNKGTSKTSKTSAQKKYDSSAKTSGDDGGGFPF